MSPKERLLEFFEDHDVLKKVMTWGIPILLLVFLVFGPYRIASVGGGTMQPTVGAGEYYAVLKSGPICLGDVLQFKHPENEVIAVREVMAFGGAKFSISNIGYSINDEVVQMNATWVSAARKKTGEDGELFVPEGYVLVRRATPDAADPGAYEAFLVVPVENVEGVLSRVLMSADVTRIGASLRSRSKTCVDLK